MSSVHKAVFPVAGLGARFLPATKANPKEMLPVVDRPLIQYATDESIAAGIRELIFITGRTKRSIEDHFDKAYELEAELQRSGKLQLLEVAQRTLPAGVTCTYIRQPEALGLGHAVLCAESALDDSYFAVLLADDLIDGGDRGCLQQMVDIHERLGCAVIAVENIPRECTASYGIVEVEEMNAGIGRIKNIVEKPDPADAPSTLGVVGRYILPGRIMGTLKRTGEGAGGEIQLTDAIGTLLAEETFVAFQFDGVRYDCGSKLGYLKANVDYALQHPEVKTEFAKYLSTLEW